MGDNVGKTPEVQNMERLVHGDESVLTWLLDNVVPEVWPLLLRKFADTLTREELEEVISTSLLKLWNNRKEFDGAKGDIHGWFYVIARNEALDRIRKYKHENQNRLAGPTIVIRNDVGLPLNRAERDQVIAKAFNKLNHREREVVAPLFQAAQEQPTTRELGRKLKLSEGGVRALRFRGLRKLREAIMEMGYQIVRSNATESEHD